MRRMIVDVTFLYPTAAWLFLLLPLAWWVARHRRDWRQLALRLAVFACLIVALMQPSLIHPAGAGEQVFVIDQRAVLGEEGRAAARAALARIVAAAPRGGRRTLIQLGGAPVPAQVSGVVDARERLDGGSLSAALFRALDALPLGSDASVTMIVDGRSTDRHWRESVDALVARHIPVNTIALHGPDGAAFIADVSVGTVRVGEAVPVTVAVQGDGRPHAVSLMDGDRRLASASFAAEGPARVALRFPAAQAGFQAVRAVLDGQGGVEAVAAVQEPLGILYLGDRQVGGAAQLQRLIGRGFSVAARPAGALATAIEPARWPLLILDDVPAARFPAAAQRRVAAAVAGAGTGLIASGGEAAFGMGGYATTPLAAVLPVEAKQEEKLEKPSVALAIVIDSSGSMAGAPLDLAKQIARQTVRKLTPADSVGVVEFYGAKQWAVPMQRARDTAGVERAIGRMQSQGASMLFPALQEAYFGLKDVDARYKHILVISDGGVAEDRYQQLLRHIAEDRINVSTAVVGGDTGGEASMAEWARLGRGRFYSVPDEFSLVELDFKQPQVKPQPGYRSGGFPLRAAPGTALWQGGATPAMPPLAGYAPVTARTEAETLLTAPGGDAVLSSWYYGSGRVTALATEPLGAGTAPWRRWSGYGGWLARLAAMTARQRPAFDVALTRRFDRLTIVAQRLGRGGGSTPVIRLVDAAGHAAGAPVAVEQRAPGLFVADLPLAGSAAARVEVRDGDMVVRAADRARSDVSREDAMPLADALPLDRLSQRTRGWYRDDAAAAPGPIPAGSGRAAIDLWPWLSLLALVLYLAEIVYRRLPSRSAGNR